MTAILEVEGLTKVYERDAKMGRKKEPLRALDNVSFRIAPNETVGLLGPNGAGKTTAIKCISGLIIPTSGRVQVDGIDAARHPNKVHAKLSAVLEGNRNIYWRLTAKENLEFFAGLQGIPSRTARPHIEKLIDDFKLRDKAKTAAAKLSRGMQQRLAIACAFVKRTPLLFLDEPTLGLDVESAHDFRSMLRELSRHKDTTIVLSSHDMPTVEALCDRVIIINRGQVVADDSVKSLLQVFQARAYSFAIAAPLDVQQKARVSERLPQARLIEDGERHSIHIELDKGVDFYLVADVLREAKIVIDAIDRRDPDLEKILMKILQRGKEAS